MTIALVLFSTLAIKAQPYQSVFGPDTTKWTSFWCTIDAMEYYTVFVTNNDTTTIDGKTYRISYYYNVCNPERVDKCGYMREDTITGKIWHLPSYENNKEFLAMDLGLQKADTFILENSPYHSRPIFKITVDSVFFEEDKKVIQFNNFSGCIMNGELFFIESIGPGYGLFPLGSRDPDALLFKHHNDSLVYTSPSYEDFSSGYMYCGNSVDESNLDPLFEIKSIISTNVELFIGKDNKQTMLAVFDLSGRLILRQDLHEGNNIVELSKKGQYIFHIKNCCQTKSIKINL